MEMSSRPRNPINGRFTRYDLPTQTIVSLHWDKGLSVNQIAKMFNVSRRPINRRLDEARVGHRNQSQSETVKWSRMSEEQSRNQRRGLYTPQVIKKSTESRQQYWREHPREHPNYLMGKKGFVSKGQMSVFYAVRRMFPSAELEYPIRTKHSVRYADVAVPSLKVDVEYDGGNWHNPERDEKGDRELTEVGWSVIHISDRGGLRCTWEPVV